MENKENSVNDISEKIIKSINVKYKQLQIEKFWSNPSMAALKVKSNATKECNGEEEKCKAGIGNNSVYTRSKSKESKPKQPTMSVENFCPTSSSNLNKSIQPASTSDKTKNKLLEKSKMLDNDVEIAPTFESVDAHAREVSSKVSNCKDEKNPVTIKRRSNAGKIGKVNRKLKAKASKPNQSFLTSSWLKKSKTEQQKTSVKNCSSQSTNLKEPKQRNYKYSEKYKMLLPTFEYIVAYQKRALEEEKVLNELAKQVEVPVKYEKYYFEEEEEDEVSTNVVLECKHLSNDELKSYFYDNYQYLEDIVNGVQYSVRHEKYLKCNSRNQNYTFDDLIYNTSMIRFNYDQKLELLRLLDKKFENTKPFINDQYFMKVLLPELCKRIFMGVHNMTCEEATVYLDNAPLKPIL